MKKIYQWPTLWVLLVLSGFVATETQATQNAHAATAQAVPLSAENESLLSRFHLTTGVSALATNPGSFGGEFLASATIHPWVDEGVEKGFAVGPRLSYLFASVPGGTRKDLNVGGEGILWLFNALGPGAAVDYSVVTSAPGVDASGHFRLEGFFAVRWLRLFEGGAFGQRLSLQWDSQYQWGAKLALTIQWNGIEHIGD